MKKLNGYIDELRIWPHGPRAAARMYVLGFVLSLLCTLGAYLLATHHALPQSSAMIVIAAIAGIQFLVQIICFLHLGRDAASRERRIVLMIAAVIVLILLSGSIWIMDSLNKRMMPSTGAMMQYMDQQGGL